MLASARGRAWRRTAASALPLVPGRNVGRAFTPAAWGSAPPQGFRDDASIIPYETWGKALPGFAGYFRRKAAMHPSVCAFRRIHLPLQGRLCKRFPPKRLPCKGLRSRAPPAADTARRSRCSGRRTQVCFSTCSAMRAPQTGNVGVSRLRGAAPCLANTLPGCRIPPGPPSGLAADYRFRIASRSRPQCRAGDFARRLGLAASQAFRDDASIVPYETRGKALPGFAGYFRRKAAMHPSVCAFRRIHLPLQGRLCKRFPPKRLPCKGLRSRAPPAADTARRSRCSGRRTQVCFSTCSAMRAPQTGNVGVSRLRGAAPCLANTLPGCRIPPGPPSGLAADYRFRIASRSRPQCRAGDFARRLGLAASQAFRDDASIVPYETWGKALPGFAGYFRRKAAMHPSVACGDTSPYRGGFANGFHLKGSPARAAESSAACGGYSETEQVQRSQNASVLQHTQRDAGTANR